LLIYPGAFGIGLLLGLLTAFLMELLARRVRGVEDLAGAINVPVLGVIAGPPRARRSPFLAGPGAILALPGGRKAARA
jgi:hypothetical protein